MKQINMTDEDIKNMCRWCAFGDNIDMYISKIERTAHAEEDIKQLKLSEMM